ncbi:MAG: adenosylcobinamide-GDP ribazoletransferase [Methyloceanibacter sp.]|nr:adenosylcobinamide-GDP ribazoletransferase [Methyloceanibacter sp.]
MGGITTDLRTGLAFCTRLPVTTASDGRLSDAAWTLPIAGAVVGLIGALILYAALALGVPPFAAATLAIGATALTTGCLHEDGLADTADGFGGGREPSRVLEILRDSRIGTYGVIALIVSFLLRIGTVASLAALGAWPAIFALISAHTGARAALPLFMRAVPRARDDGLSAAAGRPSEGVVAGAAVIGVAVSLVCLGFGTTLVSAILVAAALTVLARMATRKIGGQTGDVLGAAEQAGEILILITAAAVLAP